MCLHKRTGESPVYINCFVRFVNAKDGDIFINQQLSVTLSGISAFVSLLMRLKGVLFWVSTGAKVVDIINKYILKREVERYEI